MKIWYQSYSNLGFDTRWDFYGELLKKHFKKVARPDTEIHIHGLKLHPKKMVDNAYFQYLHVSQAIDNALRAEQAGYDAFVLVGMLDLGFREIRSTIEIPALFSLETSLHVACLLARKFTLITPNDVVLRGAEELIKYYGFQDRYVPGSSYTELSYPYGFIEVVNNPKPLMQSFVDAAKKAIKAGAEIVVPGSATTGGLLIENGIREIEGVPVLDLHGTLIKMAEVMVDMKKVGISRSKKGFYFTPSKTEIAETRKLFGLE